MPVKPSRRFITSKRLAAAPPLGECSCYPQVPHDLTHRIFSNVRLDIEIEDRFGKPVVPREWFLVPLFVIDQAVEKIKDGLIAEYTYDPNKASLVTACEA